MILIKFKDISESLNFSSKMEQLLKQEICGEILQYTTLLGMVIDIQKDKRK